MMLRMRNRVTRITCKLDLARSLADLFVFGVAPIDCSPILLLMPFGFRIAPDTLPSGIFRATGLRSALAVSGFRLCARLGFSIPVCSPGQRGVTPAFGYGPPLLKQTSPPAPSTIARFILQGARKRMRTHPSAEGTSTPMTHALPSAPYDPVRLPHGPLPNTQRRSRDLRPRGSPPITRITLPPCHAHYPDGSNGCICRLLPRPPDLPRCSGGSASISSLSRPAQALLTLRPAGSLNRPRRPSSRGSGPASHPARPLVSYQINRQLSGWNLPPLVRRAFGTHRTKKELAHENKSCTHGSPRWRL